MIVISKNFGGFYVSGTRKIGTRKTGTRNE